MIDSRTSVPPATPTRLEYASRLTRRGITLEESPNAVRVVFPQRYPLGAFIGKEMLQFALEAGIYLVPLGLLLGISFLFSTMRELFFHVVSHWQNWIILSLLGLAAWLKLRPLWRNRRNLPSIELNDAALVFANHVLSNGELANLSFPRRKVYDFKFCEHSGNLVIRAHGSEILECQPHRDPTVLRDVARIFRDTLRLP